MRCILEAWQDSPRQRKNRQWRKRVLCRLRAGQPLQPADQKLLSGLQALGLCDGEQLTAWGSILLEMRSAPTPVYPSCWLLNGEQVSVSFSIDWGLLWKLEAFLIPVTPLTYHLTTKKLRRAAQKGEILELIQILEKGTGAPLPRNLCAQILNQPIVRVLPMTVLEFSSPAELRQLRSLPTLRPHLSQLLSPHHATIATAQTAPLLKMLERRGVYATRAETAHPISPSIPKRTHFQRVSLLQPLGAAIPIKDFLEQAIKQQNAFDMLYHSPGGERPETHRITPLLIEARGEHTYVIAYSHHRKGQRTYRLDRMDIPGTTHPKLC